MLRQSLEKEINDISGVLQGSHLGLLLFNLFINDLPQVISHAHVLMCADDVKLCASYLQ